MEEKPFKLGMEVRESEKAQGVRGSLFGIWDGMRGGAKEGENH